MLLLTRFEWTIKVSTAMLQQKLILVIMSI